MGSGIWTTRWVSRIQLRNLTFTTLKDQIWRFKHDFGHMVSNDKAEGDTRQTSAYGTIAC